MTNITNIVSNLSRLFIHEIENYNNFKNQTFGCVLNTTTLLLSCCNLQHTSKDGKFFCKDLSGPRCVIKIISGTLSTLQRGRDQRGRGEGSISKAKTKHGK